MNPLLQTWDTPFGLPPFDLIEDEHYAPALEEALVESRERVAQITQSQEQPTFENTIEALERVEEPLRKVLAPFYSVAAAASNETREALQRDFAPVLSAFSSEVSSNKELFGRIEALYQSRDELYLDEEQQRVLLLARRSFVRSGALLEGAEADRLAEIKQRASVLGTRFTQNILGEERSWFMALEEPADLEALPESLIAAARAAGEEKGQSGPVITLSRSIIVPFLQFSPNRALREKAYEAWTSRGVAEGEKDNRAIATEQLELRQEMAKLLGFDSFARYKLEVEMASEPDNVRTLLDQVWQPAKAAAVKDADILEEMMHADGIPGDLEPWDWRYYSEKRRLVEHDLNESELKEYLALDRMIEAAFDCANRLFGLEFKAIDVALYHPDCRAWEVTRDSKHIAVFIGDYFARGGKFSGAWCSGLRTQHKLGGDIRPHVINVCNFAKPSEGEPALLSFDDARTLFHEFGHALHQMLSDLRYPSISGTSVAQDFVELPSQLYEHWLEVPEVLQRYATHYESGEPMPQELLERMLAATTYDTGFATVEYLASALVDLELHDGPAPEDAMERQGEVLESLGMPKQIRMRHATPNFAHVFGGYSYAAGYYSYMWSEVMDADAFEAFKDAGDPFHTATAEKLEKHILSAGGSHDAEVLYKRFRGAMPDATALLRGRGLL